jgi:hypothetical protein
VPLDTAKALGIATSAKLPNLTSYIARRMTAKSASSDKPVVVTPGKPSADGLLLQVTSKNAHAHPHEAAGGHQTLMFHRGAQPIVVKHRDDLSFEAAQDFTIAAHVRIRGKAEQRWQGLITKSRDQRPWYGLWIDSRGQWCFGATGSNLSGPQASNGFHWVVGVQEASKRRLYLNGKEVATGTAQPGDGRGELWIGGAKGVDEMFNGGIIDARVYDRALTDAEVETLGD